MATDSEPVSCKHPMGFSEYKTPAGMTHAEPVCPVCKRRETDWTHDDRECMAGGSPDAQGIYSAEVERDLDENYTTQRKQQARQPDLVERLRQPRENLDGQVVSPLCREAADEIERWRSCYLDQPEDRLYHAKDQTWWRRDDTRRVGALVRAEPPAQIERLRAEIQSEREAYHRERQAARHLVNKYLNVPEAHKQNDGPAFDSARLACDVIENLRAGLREIEEADTNWHVGIAENVERLQAIARRLLDEEPTPDEIAYGPEEK